MSDKNASTKFVVGAEFRTTEDCAIAEEDSIFRLDAETAKGWFVTLTHADGLVEAGKFVSVYELNEASNYGYIRVVNKKVEESKQASQPTEKIVEKIVEVPRKVPKWLVIVEISAIYIVIWEAIKLVEAVCRSVAG